MIKTYTFRIYPNNTQIHMLESTLDTCRKLYNAMLQQRICAYGMGKKVTYYSQKKEIPDIKKAFPEFKNVYSQVLQDVAGRLDKAFDNFFRRIKEKKSGKHQKAGFPRFKPINRYRSITYPQSGFGIMENGHLKLSKIGILRMFMHRDIEGEIRTVTISRDRVGDWYASFTVEMDVTETHTENTELQDQAGVGADLGITHLVTLSDGTFVDTPHFLVKAEKRLKRDQRHLSRKRKGSANRNKQKMKVAKRHRKVKRQREDFVHKVSDDLASNYGFLSFADLNVAGMVRNRHLAKSISDASWSMLVQYTAYKAGNAGKVVVQVNPGGTSKTCSRCGWVKDDMKLSDRIFHCNDCGLEIDRDLNAAINIYKRGMKKIGRGTPEFTPVEIGALSAMATPIVEAGSPRL